MPSLKICYGSDIRRVTVQETLSFDELYQLIKDLYGQESIPKDFGIKYTDDEDDLVSITCDHELQSAFAFCGSDSLLRLTLSEPKNYAVDEITQTPPPKEVIHSAKCNHCDHQIVGIRYKCANCPDYNLCECCEAKRPHDHQHLFLKIYNRIPKCQSITLLPNLYAASSFPPTCGGYDQDGAAYDSNCPNWVAQRGSQNDRVYRPGMGRRRWQNSPHNGNKLMSRFVMDITYEDGSATAPGTPFIKIWRIKNNGNTAWPEGTKLCFVSGDVMGVLDSVPAAAVPPGAEIDIAVDMIAPQEYGRYVSNWRLCTSSGVFFGHRVWADIMVKETAAQTQRPNHNDNDNNDKHSLSSSSTSQSS